jgi:hypothetical protein
MTNANKTATKSSERRFHIMLKATGEVVATVSTRNATSAVIAAEARLGLPPCALYYMLAQEQAAQSKEN